MSNAKKSKICAVYGKGFSLRDLVPGSGAACADSGNPIRIAIGAWQKTVMLKGVKSKAMGFLKWILSVRE
jgi:hypothetical protein